MGVVSKSDTKIINPFIFIPAQIWVIKIMLEKRIFEKIGGMNNKSPAAVPVMKKPLDGG